MITLVMTAAAIGLVFVGWSWQRHGAPDVERVAGRVWGDVRHETFDECTRDNGLRFWMGCTDKAPIVERRR